MAFEDIQEECNKLARDAGIEIYTQLRTQFPEESMRDYDIILNSLCMGILCLIHSKVNPDNRAVLVQIVHKILMKNIHND